MLYSLPFFSNITFFIFYFLINNFIYFTSQSQFSLPRLLLIPPSILSLYPSLSNSERGQPSIGFNKLTYHVENQALHPALKMEEAIQHEKQVLKNQFKHQGQVIIPLLGTPQCD